MKNKTEQNNHIALLEIEANNYMRKETSLSPKSIKNYTQAIRKVATDLANIYGAEKSKELRTCTGDKLDIIGAHYFMIEKNRSQNKKGKDMYRCGWQKIVDCRRFNEAKQKGKKVA